LFDFDREVEWKEKYQVLRDLKSNGYGLGLKVGLRSSTNIKSAVLQSVLHEINNMIDAKSKTIFLPALGGDKEENEVGSSFSITAIKVRWFSTLKKLNVPVNTRAWQGCFAAEALCSPTSNGWSPSPFLQ
jgi:hypothetical protein